MSTSTARRLFLAALAALLACSSTGCASIQRAWEKYRERQRHGEPAPVLVFRYGGFHGENAVEDPATQIADLHMTRAKLSYRWATGSLKNWGLADSQADALACAFYWDADAGAWIGGKFDWISTSRTTRGLEHLNGYNGWQPDPFWAAPRRAFCIVSKDGRRRTNLIETTEP